jgi:receptor protein-tyrosine kinase
VLEGNSQVQSINLARLHRMGVVSPDAEKSKIAEEFRIIKRPLIANAFGQGTTRVTNGNLIMVTSSLPGEGKSFCAINLAISMAMEMDRSAADRCRRRCRACPNTRHHMPTRAC